MRTFIRHPSDIPIELMVEEKHSTELDALHDVSYGGLSFISDESLEKGVHLHIRIDTVQPPFEADGVVVWCHRIKEHYMVGMEFSNKEDVFLVRMVEQICHIEHYKKEVEEQEGRTMTSQEAAIEWINKYADVFPDPNRGQSS